MAKRWKSSTSTAMIDALRVPTPRPEAGWPGLVTAPQQTEIAVDAFCQTLDPPGDVARENAADPRRRPPCFGDSDDNGVQVDVATATMTFGHGASSAVAALQNAVWRHTPPLPPTLP